MNGSWFKESGQSAPILFTLLRPQIAEKKRPTSMKEFLDKFFEWFTECQQEISPKGIAKVLRGYADRMEI